MHRTTLSSLFLLFVFFQVNPIAIGSAHAQTHALQGYETKTDFYGPNFKPDKKPYNPDSIYPGDSLCVDLGGLRTAILESHTDPFKFISEANFHKAFDAAEKEAEKGMTKLDFYFLVGQTLTQIMDSHLGLSSRSLVAEYQENGGLILPISLYSTDEYQHIVKFDLQKVIPKGTELISINGNPYAPIWEKCLTIAIREGNSKRGQQRYCDAISGNLIALLIDIKAENKIVGRTPEGKTVTYTLKGLTKKEIKKIGKEHKKENKNTKKVELFFYEKIEDKNTAVLTIKSFAQGKSKDYYKFLKKSFKTIQEEQIENVIIDLRYNTGGSGQRMEDIYDYITKKEFNLPAYIAARQSDVSLQRYKASRSRFAQFVLKRGSKKHDNMRVMYELSNIPKGQMDTLYYTEVDEKSKYLFSGNTFLLMNGLSGSASVNFAGAFKYYEIGKIAGEPCLGPMAGTWGNPSAYKMKNSGISAIIPVIRFNAIPGHQTDAEPVQPDAYVPISQQDIFEEKDPQLDYILENWIK